MDVEANLKLDEEHQDFLIDLVAAKLANQIESRAQDIVDKLTEERGMNQKEIAVILGCESSTVRDYYLEQPGFPFYWKGTVKMFWPSAVKKWIVTHQESMIKE